MFVQWTRHELNLFNHHESRIRQVKDTATESNICRLDMHKCSSGFFFLLLFLYVCCQPKQRVHHSNLVFDGWPFSDHHFNVWLLLLLQLHIDVCISVSFFLLPRLLLPSLPDAFRHIQTISWIRKLYTQNCISSEERQTGKLQIISHSAPPDDVYRRQM